MDTVSDRELGSLPIKQFYDETCSLAHCALWKVSDVHRYLKVLFPKRIQPIVRKQSSNLNLKSQPVSGPSQCLTDRISDRMSVGPLTGLPSLVSLLLDVRSNFFIGLSFIVGTSLTRRWPLVVICRNYYCGVWWCASARDRFQRMLWSSKRMTPFVEMSTCARLRSLVKGIVI